MTYTTIEHIVYRGQKNADCFVYLLLNLNAIIRK